MKPSGFAVRLVALATCFAPAVLPGSVRAGGGVARSVNAEAVTLDYNLGPIPGDPTIFKVGSVIATSHIADGHVAGADTCTTPHLHALAGTAGITIDGHGPYEDMNRASCGYGAVAEGPEADLDGEESKIWVWRTEEGESRLEFTVLVRNLGPEVAESVG